MPYPNMPKDKWGEMERCVAHLTSKHGKDSAHAICYDSIMGKKKKKDKEYSRKAIKRLGKHK